jgi:intracellular multiplication protein IcmL
MSLDGNTERMTLRDDFYRDSFGRVIFLITSIVTAIVLLSILALYLFIQKPKPITFVVNQGFRIQGNIPLDQPYISIPDLLQWVNDTFAKVFILDFVHYPDQLNSYRPYFTEDGWKVFLNQINNYASKDLVTDNKLFVSATPTAAPVIFGKGLVTGRYGWRVNVPLSINFNSDRQNTTTSLTLQILVVRVPTDNNLSGIAIDNVIVLTNQGGASSNNG